MIGKVSIRRGCTPVVGWEVRAGLGFLGAMTAPELPSEKPGMSVVSRNVIRLPPPISSGDPANHQFRLWSFVEYATHPFLPILR